MQEVGTVNCITLRAICEAQYIIGNVLQADALDPYVAKTYTFESVSRDAQLCTEDLMSRQECSL